MYNTLKSFHRFASDLLAIFFSAILLLGVLPLYSLAEPLPKQNIYEQVNDRGIWDYNFTRAKSGMYWEIPDKGSSNGKSGNKPETQKHPIPTWKKLNIHHDEVEALDIPFLLHPNDDKTLTVLRSSKDIMTNVGRIPRGYYQVALRAEDPSQSIIYPPPKRPWKHKNKRGPYQWIVMKKQQRELGIFPIVSTRGYKRERWQRKSRRPFAVLETNSVDPSQWVISIYYRGDIYSAPVTQAYRPVIYPTTTKSPYPQVEYVGNPETLSHKDPSIPSIQGQSNNLSARRWGD